MLRQLPIVILVLLTLSPAARPADPPRSPGAPWEDLASADGNRAYRAVAVLAADPARCVSLFKERLRPGKMPDTGRIPRLLGDLDSEDFDTREKATKELSDFGELAEAALKKALDGKPSPELRRRAEELLDRVATRPMPAPRRREMRAVEALELAGTPEARQLLDKLAKGPADAWLTQEAQRTRERLARRAGAPRAVAVKPDPDLSPPPKGRPAFSHEYGAWAVAFSADGKLLFSGAPHEAPRAWDAAKGTELRRYAGQENRIARGLFAMALSPDGTTLAAGSHTDFRVHLWDVATGKEWPVFAEAQAYTALAFSPDGKYLAAASITKNQVILYDLAGRREVRRFAAGDRSVPCLAFSPDGRTLATPADRDGVRLWEIATGAERTAVAKVGGGQVSGLAFSPDGKTLAVADNFRTIHLLDRFTLEGRARFPGAGRYFAYSADGKFIASTDIRNGVHVWDVAAAKELYRLEAEALGVAFSPDGKTLAAAGQRPQVWLWDVATGKERK